MKTITESVRRAEIRAIHNRATPIALEDIKHLTKGAVLVNSDRPWTLVSWEFLRVIISSDPDHPYGVYSMAPRDCWGNYASPQRVDWVEWTHWFQVTEEDIPQLKQLYMVNVAEG